MPAETPSQLPLDLTPRPGFSREELVVTPANADAVALVDRWPNWPAPVAVLAGPAGSGKSHLAAVWQERAGAHAPAADGLDAAAIDSAASRPVLIEDADARTDEAALFHVLNAARGGGQSVLLTSRRFPSAWRTTLPDLASRLRAATVVEIGEPDDLLLSAVMTKLFADRQVVVEPHVIAYVAARIERSLDTARRVVERLDAAALARQTRITRALAGAVISAIDAGQRELDLDG